MSLTNKSEPRVFETGEQEKSNWRRSRYKAAFDDGVERFIDGISNGCFGLSGDYVLTHLATGFKDARFQCEESGKTAGNYLRNAYADEFATLVNSIEPSMTWEQYKTLPSTTILNHKIQADIFFNAMLAAYEVREKEIP